MKRRFLTRILPVIFALTIAVVSFSFAFEPTPLRISVWPKEPFPCKQETTTIGLDLGLIRTNTCKVIGLQLSPLAAAANIYGVQVGLLGAMANQNGYGVQIGGLISYTGWTYGKYTFYGLQVAGIANNVSPDRTVIELAGVQVAGVGNMAYNVTGMQVALINDSEKITGIQAGAVNMLGDNMDDFGVFSGQFGLYNRSGMIRGVQFGLVNYAGNLEGVQIGLINIVSKKHRKLPFPFTPLLNLGW